MHTFETDPASGADVAPSGEHRIRTRAVASWVLFDLANTIFSMGVVSVYFSAFVRISVGENRVDFVYGTITAISMAVIFVVSPLLGAATDRARRRMPFLIASTLICVGFTLLLARLGFYGSAVCFIIANIAYQAGLQFYDAMLPEVSTPENRGRIGGIGVGVGYLGSYVAIGMGLLLGADTVPKLVRLFAFIAIGFLLFAIPCFLFVKERGNPHPRPINLRMALESTRETIRTLRSGQQYPGLLRFLIGRIFYTDGINTVIAIMFIYTANVAKSAAQMTETGAQQQGQLIMLTAITFAVAGGFFWGWLTDRIGPKRTLNYVLQSWMGIFAFAALIGIADLPLAALYVVACMAGFALGGIWAADRPYMLQLTPPARIGEFYGLYGMVGRFSAITGPGLWGLSGYLLITRGGMEPLVGQGIAILLLLTLVIVSYVILQKVSDAPRTWTGSDLERARPQGT